MKKITIDGTEYTLKYSMRATLQNDCIRAVTKLLVETDDSDDAVGISNLVADVVPTVSEAWYAGLIEHHGTHKYGDGKVPDKETADELLFALIEENIDKEDSVYSDYFGVMQELVECMNDDGFFKRIGLDRMFMTTQTEEVKTEPKAKRGRPKKTEVGEK